MQVTQVNERNETGDRAPPLEKRDRLSLFVVIKLQPSCQT